MPTRSTKSFAIVLQIVLGLVLVAILGLLSGLLTGDPEFLKWLNAQSWYSPRNAAWATGAVLVAMVAVAVWQYFSTKDDKESLTREDLGAQTRIILEGFRELALQQGRIPAQSDQDKDAEINRLTQELQKLQTEVAARSSEPAEAELSKALDSGDLDTAIRLKSQQVEARREESQKLPRDMYELGTIHELRFEWPQALAAYRGAWEMGHTPEYGVQFAAFASRLNHFSEAIATYESLLELATEPEDRAGTLNNLGLLYQETQRLAEAEQAFEEAVSIYIKLAEADPGAYLPSVAATRENLGRLYRATQRTKEAERAYVEALTAFRKFAETDPETFLPCVANTLNDLALLYSNTGRVEEAKQCYAEALITLSDLAEANPGAYLPEFAMTQNNLANLLSETGSFKEAEGEYENALAVRRQLAEVNPDAFLPDVAMTLNNLGALYADTERVEMAERSYGEALVIYRELAEVNPEAFLPHVAMALTNIANIYRDTGLFDEAEKDYAEALTLRRKLAETNPSAHLPAVAVTLNNYALLYLLTDRTEEALARSGEAEQVLEPLWEANPDLHGSWMTKILWNRALISEAAHRPAAEACSFAQRALVAAHDPVSKNEIQRLVDRLCPASPG